MTTGQTPGAVPSSSERVEPTVAFEQERGRLFGVAYRMLGSVVEAEDVVQDAYMRWHGAPHETVNNVPAYLVALTTHLCIDALKSARRRRTDYIGPWLPEPLLAEQATGSGTDPVALQELADDLSMAFMLLLERLTPLERAVFLLHESFDYSYEEIAGVVGRSATYCRQIAQRARKHLGTAPRTRPADPLEHDRLLDHFLEATSEGDLQGLIDLLANDVVMYSDGGGKVHAARQPIRGAVQVARFVLGVQGKAGGEWAVQKATINGQTGLMVYIDGRLQAIMTMLVVESKVHQLFLIVNPQKLPTG